MPKAQLSFAFHSEDAKYQARAAAVVWIKTAVVRHGITIEQLVAAGCFSHAEANTKSDKHSKYMDANGHSWDGSGPVPEWLQRAVNAGQSMEHFRVS